MAHGGPQRSSIADRLLDHPADVGFAERNW
jgi:hypothetical protein